MKALFDSTWMYPESWISPSDIGAFYRGMMDAVFASNSVTQGLGDLVLFAGLAGLAAVPLAWGVRHMYKQTC